MQHVYLTLVYYISKITCVYSLPRILFVDKIIYQIYSKRILHLDHRDDLRVD